jgi:quercetin dioxygenase-like cupin family protein
VASAGSQDVRHVSVVGDVYSILLTGRETAGRYCLIDMRVPPGGGPGPHRHDFEEMFTMLEGEVEFTFRGETSVVRAGTTVNVPANAPHFFSNRSGLNARMLCMCTPPGLEDFFLEIGDPMESSESHPRSLSHAEMQEFMKRAAALAPKDRTELLKP